MTKDINDYTLKELQEMDEYKPTKTFRWVIIVPMDEIHDSGFRCMKFVVGNGDEICGVIYTGSDVVCPDGITGINADCLVGSGCIRLMPRCNCELDSFIGSSFAFHITEEEK